MVIRVFVSGISGNKEVKKRQQRVTMILDSKSIEYTVIDIAEPGKENEKEFMQENSKPRDSKHALPPQIFNGDRYCGDYEDFDMANELDELEKFLNLSTENGSSNTQENGMKNGPKIDTECQNLMKKDIRESTQETVDTVSKADPEAVSIGNGIESSEPSAILTTLGDIPQHSHPSGNLGESSVDGSNCTSPKQEVFDESQRNDEDEIIKEVVEHESVNEDNVESEARMEEDSVDSNSDD